MKRLESQIHSPSSEAGECQLPVHVEASATAGPAIPADRQRWAQLIADGEVPFPSGLDREEEVALATEVIRRRRARLFRYIARTIALDIHRTSCPPTGG